MGRFLVSEVPLLWQEASHPLLQTMELVDSKQKEIRAYLEAISSRQVPRDAALLHMMNASFYYFPLLHRRNTPFYHFPPLYLRNASFY